MTCSAAAQVLVARDLSTKLYDEKMKNLSEMNYKYCNCLKSLYKFVFKT